MPDISIQWDHLLHQLNTYQGQYEYHLTVDLEPNNTQQLHAFETLCSELNAKAIVIQLASGETPTQPMLGQFLEGHPETVGTREIFGTLRYKYWVVFWYIKRRWNFSF